MDDMQARTFKGQYDSNEAIGVPTTGLTLGRDWDLTGVPGLTLTGRVIYASSQYCSAANPQCNPPWTRLDIGARYRRYRRSANHRAPE
jgi:iron complex outermembrane receptor protein